MDKCTVRRKRVKSDKQTVVEKPSENECFSTESRMCFSSENEEQRRRRKLSAKQKYR
ncbi:MAG: hypothetical protein IJD14_00260 [Christensenellaceae bacterium]|nr:hypothetical protein [Christensenellaceae bacterium]